MRYTLQHPEYLSELQSILGTDAEPAATAATSGRAAASAGAGKPAVAAQGGGGPLGLLSASGLQQRLGQLQLQAEGQQRAAPDPVSSGHPDPGSRSLHTPPAARPAPPPPYRLRLGEPLRLQKEKRRRRRKQKENQRQGPASRLPLGLEGHGRGRVSESGRQADSYDPEGDESWEDDSWQLLDAALRLMEEEGREGRAPLTQGTRAHAVAGTGARVPAPWHAALAQGQGQGGPVGRWEEGVGGLLLPTLSGVDREAGGWRWRLPWVG